MKNTNFEETPEPMNQYKKAERRVKELKGFYSHLITYIAFNIVLIIFNVLYHHFGYMKIKVNQFFTIIVWGIILLVHAAIVFFGNDWEQRKIKKLMNKNK